MIWVSLLVPLFLLLAIGVPIGVALGITSFLLLEFFVGGAFQLASTATWNTFNSFTLTAVSAFIVLGEILMASGLTSRIYSSVVPLFQRLPGKLMHTNVAVGALFGSVSGTSLATAAAVGSVAYPQLAERGYPKGGVVGLLAASGTLGIILPPSLILVIYGATQDVSVGRLFLAGIAPGLFLALAFMIYIAVKAKRNPNWLPEASDPPPWSDTLLALLGLWPIVILMMAVLGTIYIGVATPTEAAALGAFTTVAMGFLFGTLTLSRLLEALIQSVVNFGTIALIMVGAAMLTQVISILGLPLGLTNAIADLSLGKYTVFLAVVFIYIVLGCFFDGLSVMLMTLPLTFPMVMAAGFDPVWYGIAVTILIEIGMITPPVGINLFVLSTVCKGEVTVAEAARETFPYWILMLVCLAIFTAFPQIITFLPNLIMK